LQLQLEHCGVTRTPRIFRSFCSCLVYVNRHQRRLHTKNNGFRFCCRIPRASHSISCRIFHHPMYASLSVVHINFIYFYLIFMYLNFVESKKKASGVCLMHADLNWNSGLVWLQTGVCWRLRRKSFQGLLWMWVLILGRWVLFVIYWNFVNLRFWELQVVIEVTLGLVLCMWAALTVPGKFLSIHPHSEENR